MHYLYSYKNSIEYPEFYTIIVLVTSNCKSQFIKNKRIRCCFAKNIILRKQIFRLTFKTLKTQKAEIIPSTLIAALLNELFSFVLKLPNRNLIKIVPGL